MQKIEVNGYPEYMLERAIATAAPESLLRERLSRYPAAALVGPRQCGKTTLARTLGGSYYDMEQEADRLRLDLQWAEATDSTELVVIDEAQAAPDIFPRLRGAIDADRGRNGRFLLLGSIAPALMRDVSESLAGRLTVVELSPLSLRELPPEATERLWRCGGYPDGGVLDGRGFPQWQRDYLALLAQRDLPSWGLPAGAQTTQRLFGLLAARHGQLWNASDVGRALGLSYHTVNAYLDYLEGAFLIRRLPAYSANPSKQFTKRPKLYWRDSGLLHSLLGLSVDGDMTSLPAVGASWEGHVIDQLLTALGQIGRDHEAWHLRTPTGREIDLVLRIRQEIWAIEIKLTTQPRGADMARLDETADLTGAHRRFLVSRQPGSFGDSKRTACDLAGMIDAATR